MASWDIDKINPDWYPLFLKELLTTHPRVFERVTDAVMLRHAREQLARLDHNPFREEGGLSG